MSRLFRACQNASRLAHGRFFSTTRQTQVLPGMPSPFPEEAETEEGSGSKDKNEKSSRYGDIAAKAGETAAVMFASLAILGLAGLLYHHEYRAHTHRKMSRSFDGWDPVTQLKAGMTFTVDESDWVYRSQQKLVDDVVAGNIVGRYFILFGEKGTGKTSMLLEAIKKVKGHNVVVMDAHADPEIFRIRIGKALNFEFSEDYLGSLFSIRGPRENTAILDIERAFNVLETVAVGRLKEQKKPLVLIINNAHLIRDDDDGRDIVELLQQKAESFSGSGLATIIFNSDDYWLYERLKRLGTRLNVVAVGDFTRSQTYLALRRIRRHALGEPVDDNTADAVYNLVGGRAQHIAAVAAQPELIRACHELIDNEKQWFLNHCALLGEDMDDDVMEYGKFSSAAMVLAREFVKLDKGGLCDAKGDIELPLIPLWRARQIMTRPDYIQTYDNLNFFTLDAHSRVKPDSVVMMHAFREIASMPGFNELLEQTLDRVAAIESLGRTREVVLKDLIGAKYLFQDGRLSLESDEEEQDEKNDDMYMLDQDKRFYWKRRDNHAGHAEKP